VDRKKQIGLPVRCGEFFPAPNEADDVLPNSKSFKRFYALLPKDAISNKTRTIRVFSPHNRKYEFPFDGWVLRRELFERAIAEEAEKNGAEIQTSTNVDAVEQTRDGIKILAHEMKGHTFLNAKLVIGADGFPSRTVQRAPLQSHLRDKNLALCVQLSAHGAKVDEETVEMYLGEKYAPGGYAWVIPKGNGEVNVGVGARLSYLKRGKSIVAHLIALSKEHPNVSKYLHGARFAPMIGKTLPVGGMTPYLYGERNLLVGDAAGLVLATNGSGIPTALASGHIAGEIAARHLTKGDELSTYADALKMEVGQSVQRGYLYRRVGDFFMRSDEALERLLQVMGTSNLAKVIKCMPIKPFFP
jgi:digeranylgeranylglycerophospholipid reductase